MTELILALDVATREKALAISFACSPYLDRIKLGYPLILNAGMSIAGEIGQTGLSLIADFKVADIPSTNRLIVESIFSSGFSSVICHGFPGEDSLQACVDTAHGHGGECYVVAEMSHPGATRFFQGGIAEEIAMLALQSGADGIIAPATRPSRVAALRGIVKEKKILSPGVGTQGGDIRSIAPFVDGIIVGRSIYENSSPVRSSASYRDILNSLCREPKN